MDEDFSLVDFTQGEDMSASQIERMRNAEEENNRYDDSDDWWTLEEPPTEDRGNDHINDNEQDENEQKGNVDIGQYNQAWIDIMENFASKKMYTERMDDFVTYVTEHQDDRTLEQTLQAYFKERATEKSEDGTDRYRASTMRGWLSVFCKFWKFV